MLRVRLRLSEQSHESGGIAGELGDDAQLRAEREDGELGAGLQRGEVIDHPAADAHLVAGGRVERVEAERALAAVRIWIMPGRLV